MYGVDTISCGATIAFAMECFEKGLLDEEACDGIKLKFGNAEALPTLIEKIAMRQGIGDLLAEGSYRAAEKIGKEAVSLTVTVKKQELPAHMPQFKPAVGLIYAVNPFGADHQSSEHDPFLVMPPDSRERTRLAKIGIHKGYEDNFTMDDEKVRFALDTQKYFSILDTLCLCQFVWGPSWELFGPDEMVELCKYGLGWDDQLPEKMFIPLKGGPSDGVVLDKDSHEKAKELYYELAGWDKVNGSPTDATMKKLSLQWLINQ